MAHTKMKLIRNDIDLFDKRLLVANAREASKKYWNYYSVLEDNNHRTEIIRNGDAYDGAHLYPSGIPKYKHLACIPANIFPMLRTAHRSWDEIKTMPDKISMLVENSYHEYRSEIINIIEKLNSLL